MSGLSREQLKWVQKLDLSYPIKNPKRDFATGFLFAEILSRFLPDDVSMHSFEHATSVQKKSANWELLLRISAKKGVPVTKREADAIMAAEDGAALALLGKLISFLGKDPAVPAGQGLPRARSNVSRATSASTNAAPRGRAPARSTQAHAPPAAARDSSRSRSRARGSALPPSEVRGSARERGAGFRVVDEVADRHGRRQGRSRRTSDAGAAPDTYGSAKSSPTKGGWRQAHASAAQNDPFGLAAAANVAGLPPGASMGMPDYGGGMPPPMGMGMPPMMMGAPGGAGMGNGAARRGNGAAGPPPGVFGGMPMDPSMPPMMIPGMENLPPMGGMMGGMPPGAGMPGGVGGSWGGGVPPAMPGFMPAMSPAEQQAYQKAFAQAAGLGKPPGMSGSYAAAGGGHGDAGGIGGAFVPAGAAAPKHGRRAAPAASGAATAAARREAAQYQPPTAHAYPRQVEYKPISVEEYKQKYEDDKEYKMLGRLGPDLQEERIAQQRARRERALAYGKQAKARAKALPRGAADFLEQQKKQTEQNRIEESKALRSKALEYGRRHRLKGVSVRSGMERSGAGGSHREQESAAESQDAIEEAGHEIQELETEHKALGEQVDAIRAEFAALVGGG